MCVNMQCVTCRDGLTIWKLGHCPRARGPHEMPLVPFS
ncbi:unnamed protein product [Staurois parvus]|uniref:Uncharacterized protein n=1 Tax=Staurois parvus TaxID=386267 RepID=A0ABN9DIW3_9NEOB|nr:unnamed protein product [Staurois parvus]